MIEKQLMQSLGYGIMGVGIGWTVSGMFTGTAKDVGLLVTILGVCIYVLTKGEKK